jgi:hypothetical protein
VTASSVKMNQIFVGSFNLAKKNLFVRDIGFKDWRLRYEVKDEHKELTFYYVEKEYNHVSDIF